jgi:DnaJ homolog subfamily C member 9
VESYPKFEKEDEKSREKAKSAERKARAKFEKEQAKEASSKSKSKSEGKASSSSTSKPTKKSKANDMTDLASMIRSRQQSRGGASFLDALEAKYAPKARGKKRATPMEEDEPDEEAFQAAAARLEAGRKKRK